MKATSAILWTIDELGTQVALALSENYEGQSNGSVRDIPNRRTIRYYTTLGLLAPPEQMRGRTALYGLRHLLQLAAIKRLQARGMPLAEVQQKLLGLPDSELQKIACIALPAAAVPSVEAEPPRDNFWRAEPAPVSEPVARGEPAPQTALQGVRLSDEVTLLLETVRSLEQDDIEAIRVAAEPLLKLLDKRRLTRRPERSPS